MGADVPVIDLAPMMATIAAEIALHIKGAIFPVIGTIVALLWAWWRQSRNVEKIKQGITNSLKESLTKVPNAAQRKQIDTDVAKNFKELKATVLTNINLKIHSIQLELDSAIEDVKTGNVDVEAERKRLSAIQGQARQELAQLKELCTVAR